MSFRVDGLDVSVSTHSRLKAAGFGGVYCSDRRVSFNTQPPEGGWQESESANVRRDGFNTQPPEGGWQFDLRSPFITLVSTHSRLKAAGYLYLHRAKRILGFNTQPPEGGWLHHPKSISGV